jgi:ribosomal protein S18 acetylase RimI-like enzyme
VIAMAICSAIPADGGGRRGALAECGGVGQKQGQGLGRFLLNQAVACARGLGMESVLLEVRPSNTRALEIYERYGFKQIGRRKGYYPAATGNARTQL